MNAQENGEPINPWQPQPQPWRELLRWVDAMAAEHAGIGRLRDLMLQRTGTRLIDWVDHVVLSEARLSNEKLRELGYQWRPELQCWEHPSALLPWVRRPTDIEVGSRNPCDRDAEVQGLAIGVESLEEFLRVQQESTDLRLVVQLPDTIPPLSAVRLLPLQKQGKTWMLVVQRHATAGFPASSPYVATLGITPADYQRYLALFNERPRRGDPDELFAEARRRFDQVAERVSAHWACDIFFAAERQYWMSRNRAARVQYARQQALGLGWANHDHHTYRSSRAKFAMLIETLEHFGFQCRERFYAGADAGWGAQVLEHPQCGIVVFADVDLSADEVVGDFAHEGLPPCDQFGTVGLWCRLHGEAFLEAGMHHLECQFEFDAAREQLRRVGIDTMPPFTDFPYLRQAFTEGELWRVPRERLEDLLQGGVITPQQADRWASHGTLGSHLEILQRDDGYKGFNQTGINDIIRRTDPRRLA